MSNTKSYQTALLHDVGWIPWERNPFSLRSAIKKETGGGGRCQFSSIAESMFPIKHWDSNKVRHIVAQEVRRMKPEEFKEYIADYRREKEQGEFQGDWNPHQVRTQFEFADLIEKPIFTGSDMSFWGDSRTLVLFAKARNIRIYVLSQTPDRKETGKLTPSVWNCETHGKVPQYAIMLWYSGGHYQPVGVQYLEGKKTIWTLDQIPHEIATFNQKIV